MSNLKKIDDAWLNIDVDESKIFNPLTHTYANSEEEFHIHLTWLMSQPEYFSFVCKQVFNIDILPMQSLILHELWNRKFPMLIGSRGLGKSFILSLYSMLRAFFMPGRKIVIVGAAFRQSKVLFEYMDTIWQNSPLLRDIMGPSSGPRRDVDRCVMKLGKSTITCLPLGDGTKIRGQRANDIITDEFASVPREIFENVVAGFADSEVEQDMSNQIILSGTAYYDFNHFADYWKKWRSIIKSKGNPTKLKEVFGNEEVPKDFDWTQYSIMRIPFEMLPEGFMDAAQVARSKATVHSGIYQMEFAACFTTDSQGFFKRSLIESCVVSNDNQIKLPSGEVFFSPALIGDSQSQYIIGVDPASEVDNFSIVVLEVQPDHRRIVYCEKVSLQPRCYGCTRWWYCRDGSTTR